MVLDETTNKTKMRLSIGRRLPRIHETASQHVSSVILEFGSAFLRVGIAGESKPRHIIPNDNIFNVKVNDDYVLTTLSQEWELLLSPLLENLFTNHLLIKPRTRRVIVLMANTYQYPTSFRNALESVLLNNLSVPSILFADIFRTVIPYALGHTQKIGIVLDVGRYEGRIGCVFEESCLMNTLSIVPCGYEALTRMVMDRCNMEETQQVKIKSIHDGHAIIQSCLRGNSLKKNVIGCHLPHSNIVIQIKPQIIEDCIQEMYLDLSTPNSLLHAFFTSLLACPLDLRSSVVQNVVFVGGTMLSLPGLERKFLQCIHDLFKEQGEGESKVVGKSSYTVKNQKHAKFRSLAAVVMETPLVVTYPLPFDPSVISWVGASIMGASNLPKEMWIHRESLIKGQ